MARFLVGRSFMLRRNDTPGFRIVFLRNCSMIEWLRVWRGVVRCVLGANGCIVGLSFSSSGRI
eukprot:scaffold370335_cov31-Attheya_sp.AAC.1